MSKIPQITQSELHAMLDYDPTTGVFTWRHRSDCRPHWNGRYAGKVAGYAREATGGGMYWSVRIHDWPFHAGPLAWFYVTGKWPENLIDHKDGNGLNNRWVNLRPATKRQNAANTGAPRNNTSGFKGVSLLKKTGRYRAYITQDGRQRSLGNYDTAEAAHAAYAAAAAEVYGEFARAK